MEASSTVRLAVLALAAAVGCARGSDYFTNFNGYALGNLDNKNGWSTDESNPDAALIVSASGPWGGRMASLGYTSPLDNDSVYVSHGASTPLVGGAAGANANFSVLFQIVDSDEGYDDPLADPPITGSAARDTFGFRLETPAGANLFSLYLNPWDQDPRPSADPEFNYLSWSTGSQIPTVVLNDPWKATAESKVYTFSIQFAKSGFNDVSFVATFNGVDSFSGVLPGLAGEFIGKVGAFWDTLNGAELPGSNYLLFDNVSVASTPAAVIGETFGDFTYTSDGAAITLITYTGTGGDIFIPETINSQPVTKIGNALFADRASLTHVTIPGSVISLGNFAFAGCTALTSVTIPNGVANIGTYAFENCPNLTSITLPASVSSLGRAAFGGCTGLTGAFFMGDAPSVDLDVFPLSSNVTVYYLPGTGGWGSEFSGRPALLWNPVVRAGGAGFGVGPNGFGFNISGTANIPVVVEASTNLAGGTWVPLAAFALTDGLRYFSDPDWTNHRARFYRIRTP